MFKAINLTLWQHVILIETLINSKGILKVEQVVRVAQVTRVTGVMQLPWVMQVMQFMRVLPVKHKVNNSCESRNSLWFTLFKLVMRVMRVMHWAGPKVRGAMLVKLIV